ncbi:FadR/GntR family transcriptional regulator [Maridesulfovibrio zosterae]|uniref:FadR/GntR family transcriptional regulator n=1 Tax=Maridesulfovibrio zosterae TaxID=82171 RepID=UPI00040FE1E2|nr:FadR/GntR family transcriptional regulator [Maridesulfovibrio zosterae]
MIAQNKTDSVYLSVAKQIAELIESGEFKQGDKLPPERTLAEKFQVSRSSVREAIKCLAQKNLVESRRGDGTYILTDIDADIFEAFTSAFSDQKKRLSDIFQFRMVVEPQIAALAAMAMDDETLNRLKVIIFDQQTRMRNGEDCSDLDTRLHLEIAKSTGNSIFPEMMTALNRIVEESRSKMLQSPERQEKSLAAHFNLLEAFEKRDAAKAREIMMQHIKEIESVTTNSDLK